MFGAKTVSIVRLSPIVFSEVACTKNVYKVEYERQRKIGLGKWRLNCRKTHFICKTPFLKEFWIQFSRRLKNFIPEICQIWSFQKADNQGTEAKNVF